MRTSIRIAGDGTSSWTGLFDAALAVRQHSPGSVIHCAILWQRPGGLSNLFGPDVDVSGHSTGWNRVDFYLSRILGGRFRGDTRASVDRGQQDPDLRIFLRRLHMHG